MLQAVHARLDGVVLECLDWADIIVRYDYPNTLFYLDPPYFGCEDDYGKGLFARDNYIKMADMLAQLKDKFILSINDTPEMRDTFAAFRYEQVHLKYTISRKTTENKAAELIISNYQAVGHLLLMLKWLPKLAVSH